jgi:5-(carboxyamino)imidazole ribonucleotide mutase
MGSKSDLSFAQKIEDFLIREGFKVKCEYSVSSAHRTPDMLLEKLVKQEKNNDTIVYMTIAGLSDALSGVVAGFSYYPVIACPPDIEKWGLTKTFSSVMTPSGVPVLLVIRPDNAALAAVRILALADSTLKQQLKKYIERRREEVANADREVRKKNV